MEQPSSYQLEECKSGGWKARFNPDKYAKIAATIRGNVELDVDTDHMILWHMDDVKISFAKSSGVMTVRTDDKAKAEALVDTAVAPQG